MDGFPKIKDDESIKNAFLEILLTDWVVFYPEYFSRACMCMHAREELRPAPPLPELTLPPSGIT